MLNSTDSVKSIEQEWKFSFSHGPFNLLITGENDLWLCNIAQLHTWDKSKFASGNNAVSYQSFDGPDNIPVTLNKAIRYSFDKGAYEVTISGLVNKTPSNNDDNNFGFLFQLKPVDSFSVNNNSLDDDRYPIAFSND